MESFAFALVRHVLAVLSLAAGCRPPAVEEPTAPAADPSSFDSDAVEQELDGRERGGR
ncbi:MAG: hypothetical protein AAGA54_26210 [Myxococcota bacterium]